MITIPLEEALNLSPRPLQVKKGTGGVLGRFFDIEANGRHIACGGAGGAFPKIVEENQATFSLLVHSYNHFPEVVEALKDAAHSLEQGAIDTKDKPERHFYISKAKKMWEIIAKAETVNLPD